jgi:hypothetical protein
MARLRQFLALPILLASILPATAEPPFDARAICRTAIAAMKGRDPKLIQATDAADGVTLLTYVRPIDNFIWTYRCRIEGDRVLWADEPGRWREDAADDRIFFEILAAGAQLRITANHADGSTTRQLFDRDTVLERGNHERR